MMTMRSAGGREEVPPPPGPAVQSPTSGKSPLRGSGRAVSPVLSRPLPLRRRRSKGVIAGFSSTVSSAETGVDHPAGIDVGGDTSSSPSAPGSSNQPLHVAGDGVDHAPPGPPAKPCHSGRLALLCVQNAIYMGARTQLALCPPGTPRKSLAAALKAKRQKKKRQQQHSGSGSSGPGSKLPPRPVVRGSSTASSRSSVTPEIDPQFEQLMEDFDKAEESFLSNPDPLGVGGASDSEDYEECPSSGDEDSLDVTIDDDEAGVSKVDRRDASSDCVVQEPLYTPVVADPVAGTAPMGAQGAGGSGSKLPFNYRKLRWFDSVTASDRAAARKYLRQELANAKKRDGIILTRHLRKVQRREKRRIQRERGNGRQTSIGESSVSEIDTDSDEEEVESALLEQALTGASLSRLPSNMTPAFSAALVLESLSVTSLESMEGMSKCYDGIVAAGTAILDNEIDDSTMLGSPREEKSEAPSKSEIIAALAPLLVTTLEHSSGEAILALAKLRKLCGTRRYQRRFVQRVAPCLVRPPDAAQWCLRHQNDMVPILAAVEMILDSAFDIFAPGWYERGRALLMDSQRAETLRTAASQLKRLSSATSSDSFQLGISAPGSGHGHRRGNSLLTGATPTKDGSGGSNDPLAEWEVLAVDRQIRQSIRDVFTMDWSRSTFSSIPPRDGESYGVRTRRGIISSKAKISADSYADASSGLSLTGTPLSPRAALNKVPLSPHGQSSQPPSTAQAASSAISTPVPTPDMLESTFGPSFAAQAVIVGASSSSPDNSPADAGPPSPPMQRKASGGTEPVGTRSANIKTVIGGNSITPPQTPKPGHLAVSTIGGSAQQAYAGTPPRSPSSPPRGAGGGVGPAASLASPGSKVPSKTPPLAQQSGSSDGFLLNAPQLPVMSPPHRGLGAGRDIDSISSSRSGLAPLSPGSSSLASGETSSRGASSGIGTIAMSQSAQREHYRALTSTAAERKRTVAACRALRAQITRFEEAFIQLHGRPPKGAAERAPLATTYAQYREWKRAIRADAACRIQALIRGARTRWMLLRSNSPRMARVVMMRAGRPGSGLPDDVGGTAGAVSVNVLKQLSIPVEIGGGSDSEQSSSGLGASAASGSVPSQRHAGVAQLNDEGNEISNIGVEVVISPTGGGVTPTPSLSPNWSTAPSLSTIPDHRGRISGDEIGNVRGNIGTQHRGMPSTEVSTGAYAFSSASSSEATQSSRNSPDLSMMSYAELQQRKRELKQQLKQYDMDFHRKHGRMPVKAEKEPIRHLYESYNAFKSQLSLLEKEGQQGAASYRKSSSHSDRGASGDATSSGEDSPTNTSPGQPSTVRDKKSSKDSSSSSDGTFTTPTGAPSQDLAALKAEKGTLHHMLRSYEKDFFKEHRRQVSSFADIKPVASQYRRYKEIKKAIAALQEK